MDSHENDICAQFLLLETVTVSNAIKRQLKISPAVPMGFLSVTFHDCWQYTLSHKVQKETSEWDLTLIWNFVAVHEIT